MNYEKAYKEALERAKKRFDANPTDGYVGYSNEILKEIFPELDENNNEKIRKALLNLVLNDKAAGYTEFYKDAGITCDDALAYLEQQKGIVMHTPRYAPPEQKPKMIQWTGKNLKEVIDFTGKSPRFDEWFKSWEDFENYVHNHNDILKLFCEDESHYEVPVGAWIVKTPDGYNIPSFFKFIQKPAEWSEEDEDKLKKILATIQLIGCRVNNNATNQSLIAWLKERFKSLCPLPH